MKNPIVWFEIYVDDIERATKFYETVLAVKLDNMADPSGKGLLMKSFASDMDSHGASGMLVQMEGMKAGGNSTLVYFSCEDCSVEESRVAEAGGNVMQAKMNIGEYGFISLCSDTEGNMFGLHSMK